MAAPLKAVDGNADLQALMSDLATRARAAARVLALAPPEQKNRALAAIERAIRANAPAILAANAEDVAEARAGGMTAAFVDRLTLTQARVEAMAEQHLTEEEKVRLGIEQKIYDGMTPKLEARAVATARFIDQLKLVNKELEREAGFQKLLLDKRQGDINEGLSLLDQTPSGQRDRISRQADNVLTIARANPDDEGIQRRASEALSALRKQMDELNQPVEGARSEFDKLADKLPADTGIPGLRLVAVASRQAELVQRRLGPARALLDILQPARQLITGPRAIPRRVGLGCQAGGGVVLRGILEILP